MDALINDNDGVRISYHESNAQVSLKDCKMVAMNEVCGVNASDDESRNMYNYASCQSSQNSSENAHDSINYQYQGTAASNNNFFNYTSEEFYGFLLDETYNDMSSQESHSNMSENQVSPPLDDEEPYIFDADTTDDCTTEDIDMLGSDDATITSDFDGMGNHNFSNVLSGDQLNPHHDDMDFESLPHEPIVVDYDANQLHPPLDDDDTSTGASDATDSIAFDRLLLEFFLEALFDMADDDGTDLTNNGTLASQQATFDSNGNPLHSSSAPRSNTRGGAPVLPHLEPRPAGDESPIQVKPIDILSGRGGTNNHPGNQRYRYHVNLMKPYFDTPPTVNGTIIDQRSIVLATITYLQQSGSRFLKQDRVGTNFRLMTSEECYKKAQQAFHDARRVVTP